MSIIYQLPDGRICLLCKGADTVILERLRHPNIKTVTNKKLLLEIIKTRDQDHVIDLLPIQDDNWLYGKTIQHIQEFSTEGLSNYYFMDINYWMRKNTIME
jgi:magnesium-transporting ATPase (P-type)